MSLLDAPPTSAPRTVARVALGAILVFAGISHLTYAREEFVAQVPDWFPVADDPVVVVSGVVEIGLGAALIAFGLDTDRARFIRLFFQPVLVVWALWSTAAWRDRPSRRPRP